MTAEQIDELFAPRFPTEEQTIAFNSLRDQYRSLAHNLGAFGLGTPQKAEAVRRLLESLMWAQDHAAVLGGGTERANDKLMAKHAAIAAEQSKAPDYGAHYPVFAPTEPTADVPVEEHATSGHHKKSK